MRILVIGDSCQDIYIYGKVDRLCPDAPVPILVPMHTTTTGGMAANVYENILSLQVDVDIITNNLPITKTRYVDMQTNHMIMRVDSENKAIPRVSGLDAVNFSQYDAIIVSDYNKGFLQFDDISYICDKHPLVFLDTKKIINAMCLKATFIKINEVEHNKNIDAGLDIGSYPKKFIITLGSKGCMYDNKNYKVRPVEIKDMSGAGDTFISALTIQYLKTKSIESAIKFANDCATIVVQYRGVTKIGKIMHQNVEE